MDHVKPMLAQIICDSTREKGIIARFAMAISGIFIRKVTKLLNTTSRNNPKASSAIAYRIVR